MVVLQPRRQRRQRVLEQHLAGLPIDRFDQPDLRVVADIVGGVTAREDEVHVGQVQDQNHTTSEVIEVSLGNP